MRYTNGPQLGVLLFLLPKGYLAMWRYVWLSQLRVGDSTGIQCVEAMDADEYATMLRPIPPPLSPHDKELSSPKC